MQKFPRSKFSIRSGLAGAAALLAAHICAPAALATSPLPSLSQQGFSLFQASSIQFSTKKLSSLVALAKNDSQSEICVSTQHRNCELWNFVLDHMSDADLHMRVRWINFAVNRLISYKTDRNADDDWKSGTETLQSMSGDCEDYALLKMKFLNAVGVPASRMAVVVVEGAWTNTHHAVLAVNLGGKVWILDNLREDIALDTSISDYKPLYAFNTQASWLYATNQNRRSRATREMVLQRVSPSAR